MALTFTDIQNGEAGSSVRSKINNFNNATVTQVNTNETNIAQNTADIATNTADVATNTANIATNASDIAGLQTGKANKHTLVFEAASYASQAPTALDTPIQINFGALQSNAYIDLDANGTITFLQEGDYQIHLKAEHGRTTATGVAIIKGRFTLNGTQLGETLAAKLDSAAITTPYHQLGMSTFAVNDVLKLEMYRDSAGANDGGIISIPSTLAGWADSPSVKIEIYKI